MEHENEFDVDTKLDIYNLHLEWQKQSELYGKWGKRSAKAISAKFLAEENLKVVRAEAKRELEETRAELDTDIRSNYEEYSFDKKPTEAAIMNWIVIQDQYKETDKKSGVKIEEAVKNVAGAIESEEFLKAAVLAMSHKKSSIEGEVILWVNEYFSDPKIPKTLKENVEKETSSKIRKHLRRGKED